MIQRSSTLRDQAYELIRDKIVKQEFLFGQRLSVADLSRAFGISNSPIREAISLLETDGLVVNVPNYGFFVIDFNEKMFSEIAQTICVLLEGCYDEILRIGLIEELKGQLQKRLSAQEAFKGDHLSYEYLVVAIDFDRTFVQVCNNSLLSRMFESKFNVLLLCTMYLYEDSVSEYQRNLQEHRAIVEAILANEEDLARDMIAKHYDKSYLEFPQK